MTKPFKIYSSSAGSGKTYTLTKEYLKLALQTDDPFYFRNILAVTFTNDAANEMKERILGALRGFADETTLPESKRPGNHQLLEAVLAELNQGRLEPLTEKVLRRRAGRTFSNILHDYTDFAVSTIDSFVSKLVGAFTEELEIPFNYEVTMEADEMVANAVDRVLNRIGGEQELLLSEMIEAYAIEITDDGSNWNGLPANLAVFGRQLTGERIAEAMERIKHLNLTDFREAREQIVAEQESLKNSISGVAQTCLDLIGTYGLESKHFAKGKNGVWGYFQKHATGVERQLGDKDKFVSDALRETINADEWASRGSKSDKCGAINEIRPALSSAIGVLENQKGEWLMLENILQHFYKLSVIHEISRELQFIKNDKNQVLIGDFNKALVNIILKEPVPFIYERLGEKYNHLLIDEFQDTSGLQWNNLLPLVENGLAKGHFSMVVGDAKQAIYGWRGGDMEQIVHLSNKRFDILASRHRHADILGLRYETVNHTLALETLNTNYRSTGEIVEFNNEIFRLLTDVHKAGKQLLGDVYGLSAAQAVPPTAKTGGHVEIQFIDSPRDDEANEDGLNPYARHTLEAVRQIVGDAVETGYTHGDVAVLCRSKANAKIVANFLKANGINVISQDSLLLQSSPSVALLTAFMAALHTPDDGLVRYKVLHLFYEHVLGEMPQLSPDEWQKIKDNWTLNPMFRHIETKGFILKPFKLQQLGLYELGSTLAQTFNLMDAPGQPAYVFRFLDVILDFSVSQSNHLGDFMQYWERKKESLCISTPRGVNAVTVTSVHKSKGLEYPVVIVPFADWSLLPSNKDIWWMSLDESRLSCQSDFLKNLKVRSVPVTPKKELDCTPLRLQYGEDSEKQFIEGMNLLYVALTRATDRLYLLGKNQDFSKAKERITVSLLLRDYLESKGLWESQRPHYVISQGTLQPMHKQQASGNELFTITNDKTTDWQKKARLRRMASRMFDLETFEKQHDNALRLCEALRQLENTSHVKTCLDKLAAEGTLGETERAALEKDLLEIVSHPMLKPHFAPTAQIKSVREILSRHTLNLIPPDRVAVDGTTVSILRYISKEPVQDDEICLNRYAKALKQMGYQTVEQLLVNTQTMEVTSIGGLEVNVPSPALV